MRVAEQKNVNVQLSLQNRKTFRITPWTDLQRKQNADVWKICAGSSLTAQNGSSRQYQCFKRKELSNVINTWELPSISHKIGRKNYYCH